METLRLLSLLCPDVPGVRPLFERAERRLSGLCYGRVCPTGECACASISVLRYRTARGAGESVAMGIRGIEVLRQARVGEGKWRCFPFNYTLLWLAEPPAGLDERAHSELSYARDRCKRLLSRMRAGASGKPFGQVRAKILQDALARVGGTTGVQSAMFEMDGIGVLRAAPLAMV